MIDTLVMGRHPQKFTMCGEALPIGLYDTEEKISQGLAKRIYNFALNSMDEEGFGFVKDWPHSVETMDADLPPAERAYIVTWYSPKKAEIGISGILTRKGWPILDHGMFVERF